nr:carbonic anhydrase [Kofleriaceae bacterium]
MSGDAPFVSRTPYVAEHPAALALYCSDGRFTEPVEELLRHVGHARLDTLTVPGGPGLLNPLTASYGDLDSTKRGASFLIEAHAIRDVFLIAHAGCGYYKKKLGATKTAEQIVVVQRKDLEVAAAALERAHPMLRAHMYFARLADGRVAFDAVG